MIAHITTWWSVLLLPALVAPWIAATAMLWSGRDKDSIPASTAELTRRRLWTT